MWGFQKTKEKKPSLQYYISLSMVCLLILMNITYLLRLQWRKNYLLLTITEGFFFVTRSASLFSQIGNSLNKLLELLSRVASFFLDPAWQKFGKKWRILEVFQKPETRVIRIHHCQQLIAILFWITYPRVRYPKKNDMTWPLLFPSRL